MSQPEFEYLGPYRIEAILGRGGMGTVYRGSHARSGEKVAVKVIAHNVANESKFRRRFASEVETLKRLNHPNIVKIIGVGEEQGYLFYSMEYVDGHTLYDYLRSRGNFPWEDVVQIGIEIASALKQAHDIGVIHRDLKPANLMLNSKGQVKLTDFGISKLFGATDMTAAGTVIGTADYMAPEQAEGKPVTIRSDLYSLGCVLYALLTGSAPFGGKSVPEVLYAVRFNPVPSLKEKAPKCPPEFAALVLELLEKDPQRRPPTALVVGNRLKALQQGMQKRTQDNTAIEDAHSPAATKKIGSELTSLDLSDEEDEELRVTNGDALSTREQPTEIAPSASSQISYITDQSATSPAVNENTVNVGLSHATAHDGKPADSPANASPGKANSAKPDRAARNPAPASRADAGAPKTGNLNTGTGVHARNTHFSEVDDKELRSSVFGTSHDTEMHRRDWMHYASIVAMVAMLIAAVSYAYWKMKPASADDIYQEVILAVESEDENQLLAVRPLISEFLTRFPHDMRREELKAIDDDAELARVMRTLQRRLATLEGANELSLLEQSFLDAMQTRSRDPNAGRQKLSAFLRVFGQLDRSQLKNARLIELAEFALNAKPRKPTHPQASEELAQLLTEAEKNLRPAELKEFFRSLEVLYANKPWAADQLARIRQRFPTDTTPATINPTSKSTDAAADAMPLDTPPSDATQSSATQSKAAEAEKP